MREFRTCLSRKLIKRYTFKQRQREQCLREQRMVVFKKMTEFFEDITLLMGFNDYVGSLF